MPTRRITESEVEAVVLDWLAGIGQEVTHGPEVSPGRAATVTRTLIWSAAGQAVARVLVP